MILSLAIILIAVALVVGASIGVIVGGLCRSSRESDDAAHVDAMEWKVVTLERQLERTRFHVALLRGELSRPVPDLREERAARVKGR